MRLVILATVILGVCVAEGQAQLATTFGNARSLNNRQTSSTKTGRIGPSAFLGSPFRLRQLFNPFNGITNQQTIGTSTGLIPTPGSADYFKAFEFKRLQ